jgi:hypothetical protein
VGGRPQPSGLELRATTILRMSLGEASVKLRTGPPNDDRSPDAARDVWAGVIAIRTSFDTPVPSPGLGEEVALSASVQGL